MRRQHGHVHPTTTTERVLQGVRHGVVKLHTTSDTNLVTQHTAQQRMNERVAAKILPRHHHSGRDGHVQRGEHIRERSTRCRSQHIGGELAAAHRSDLQQLAARQLQRGELLAENGTNRRRDRDIVPVGEPLDSTLIVQAANELAREQRIAGRRHVQRSGSTRRRVRTRQPGHEIPQLTLVETSQLHPPRAPQRPP